MSCRRWRFLTPPQPQQEQVEQVIVEGMGDDTANTDDHYGLARSQWIIGSSSLLSCVSCATVIVTYLRFKQIRKQKYMKVILCIAISDFMSSLCFLSIVQDGSVLCWIQGLLVNYFQLAAILWVDVVVWHLYRTVLLGKRIKNANHYHIIAWGIPFLYIALTLCTNDYGVTDGDR